MPLTPRFINSVPPDVREEGERLFATHSVLELDEQGRDDFLAAIVEDAGENQVYLRRMLNSVACYCDCDQFRPSGPACAHVWTVLCTAQAEGILDEWEVRDGDQLITAAIDELAFEPEWEDDAGGPINERRIRTAAVHTSKKSKSWQSQLADIRRLGVELPTGESQRIWSNRQILYFIDVAATLQGRGLVVDTAYRERKKDGHWGKVRSLTIYPEEASVLPDPIDRELLAVLQGSVPETFGFYSYSRNTHRHLIPTAVAARLVQWMCNTGRCLLRRNAEELNPEQTPLTWDDGPPWQFRLRIDHPADNGQYYVRGELIRGDETLALDIPVLLTQSGVLFTEARAARLEAAEAFNWIVTFRAEREIAVPADQRDELIQRLFDCPQLPNIDWPQELRPAQIEVPPRPRLQVLRPRNAAYARTRLTARLTFDYDGQIIPAHHPSSGMYHPEQRRVVVRQRNAEAEAKALLHSLGLRAVADDRGDFEFSPKQLPGVVSQLMAHQWHVEAEGKLYRQPGQMSVAVSSGIDWFELHGSADFDGQAVSLPTLLAALRSGEKTVVLGDGSIGVLPEKWLKQYGVLADMGEVEQDHLKFKRSQIGLLDALIASQPQATCDAVFQQAREKLLEFTGVTAIDAPDTFVGTLRPYQREGLGWMGFLRDFSFGGCLADDMGLGKTVQVLALLEDRRKRGLGPSLVVAPRSLIFNWKEEAARFAPNLRVIDHTGVARAKSPEGLRDCDLLLTTYGTLRNDAVMLKEINFDYLVLDEAQAIKNAASGSAKATRLLQGAHRLALSGTPVQNHLGELWSLFEFINPGMLGSARAFAATGAGARVVEPEARTLLARALRPFILRRTKNQVARDLPPRVEQTIHCQLDEEQRKMYDELRDHFRRVLMDRVERDGMNKSKILILEALLRLRQAACHPGLIDKTRRSQGSAKLDALLPQLAEVADGNHKALVFSQFTSMLSIVRDRLDRDKVNYEYLDGKTRDRAERVKRFQTDDKCKLFLISLKAGGLGLNLTAAEYVFLLDPWWNPAVEAQAIDRAHRIGQQRQVFAYRLIAQDTVEDKVLQLQSTKRELADAIINADNSLISGLGRQELELLLS